MSDLTHQEPLWRVVFQSWEDELALRDTVEVMNTAGQPGRRAVDNLPDPYRLFTEERT